MGLEIGTHETRKHAHVVHKEAVLLYWIGSTK
jgi:hypothetical protein